MATKKVTKVEPVDMKLEVVVLGVSDVDRAKAFYEEKRLAARRRLRVGRLPRRAADAAQLGEPSIIFGKGVTSTQAWLGAHPGPRRGRHRRRPRRLDRRAAST